MRACQWERFPLWPSRFTTSVLTLEALSCAAAGPAPCPSGVTDAGGGHPLANISLYDGLPDRMVELIPVPDGEMGRRDIDPRDDPYLVCSFKGTKQTVVIHETGATVCKVGDDPARAWCR